MSDRTGWRGPVNQQPGAAGRLDHANPSVVIQVRDLVKTYQYHQIGFWVQDVAAISRVRTLVATFLSGQLVPLALFPRAFQGTLRLQPFRYTLSFPLEVLTGAVPPTDLALEFALQVGYFVVFVALYRVLWRVGLRSYSAAGA